MPHGNAQLKQGRIDSGFLIEDETTYEQIADYLIGNDPEGVNDLIYLLFERKPELIDEVSSWTMGN